MHRVDATNNVTVSGKRRFSNGPPGTALAGNWHNAVQEEIANVIENEGIELVADGASDVSGDMSQLLQAIRRSSHRHHSSLVQVASINSGSGFEITLGEETRILSITQEASLPYAQFNIFPNLSTYERRELIIRNDSGSPKVFSMGDLRYLDLIPGQVARVYCMFGGGVTWWRSLSGPERTQVTFTALAFNSSLQYSRQGYVVNGHGYTHLLIPYFNFGLTSSESSIELYIPILATPWVSVGAGYPPDPRVVSTQAVGYDNDIRQVLVGIVDPTVYNSSFLGLGYETRAISFLRQNNLPFTSSGLAGLDAQVITIRNQYP